MPDHILQFKWQCIMQI